MLTPFLFSLMLAVSPATAAPTPVAAATIDARDEQAADEMLERARDLIEEGRYDRALDQLNRVIAAKSPRTDAALYWKAYSLAKLNQAADALTTISDLNKQFASSRWVRDAKALEVEIRKASGQSPSPDAQADDELKILALNGLMNNDPDRAIDRIEEMLRGNNSTKMKDRALFVLSQSNSQRARDAIARIAKDNANPDLQQRAIHYLGIMGGSASRQILDDVYRSAADTTVKRSIIRSFMVSGDKARILGLAKGEQDAALRGEAIQQLGVMGAHAELEQLYATETSVDNKKRIIQAMFVGGASDKMIDLAKNEKDPMLRKAAVRNLGLMGSAKTGDAIKAIYQSDTSPEIRKECVNALFLQNNGKTMVELARAEKDPQLKKELISKMSIMGKSKEITDYLMELLK
jgi:tetratricopeptide (TPR) repeat protein